MTDTHSAVEVDSTWSRILEYSVFAYPILLGIGMGGIGLASTRAASTPFGPSPLAMFSALFVLVGFAVVVLLSIVMAFGLYFDATAVSEADVDWSPSPILYAIGGFLFGGLVTLHYLYERYNHTAMPVSASKWWYGVALSLGLAALTIVSAASVLPAASLVTVSGLSAAILSIAIYRDAGHVRANGGEWQPNPVTYFLVTFFGFPLVVVSPLAAGYYLFKRNRHVGLA